MVVVVVVVVVPARVPLKLLGQGVFNRLLLMGVIVGGLWAGRGVPVGRGQGQPLPQREIVKDVGAL